MFYCKQRTENRPKNDGIELESIFPIVNLVAKQHCYWVVVVFNTVCIKRHHILPVNNRVLNYLLKQQTLTETGNKIVFSRH
jgi:hypothetical protein